MKITKKFIPKILNFFKNHKIISSFLILVLVFQFFYIHPDNVAPLNASLSATASVYSGAKNKDLILFLVDQDLYDDQTRFETTLQSQYSTLRLNNIKDRIERFARDVQINYLNSQTTDNFLKNGIDTAILPIANTTSPVEIASMLKQAYYQNLPDFQNYNLKGLIIIGDLPLPVVDKSGNRFISIYPYTDFENPAFIWDDQIDFFVESGQSYPYPEIWHGLINFPEKQSIAEYLDKNHLHHTGVSEFSDFDAKIFYSEPHHDAKSFNQDLFLSYQTFQALIEEFAYNRYSGKLLDLLSRNSSGLFQELSQLTQSNQSSQVKILDIFSKPAIENFITQVTDLFSVALRDQRDAILQTGRYDDANYVTGLLGIAKLDELSALYLKEVNQVLENEIDSILREVQQDIPLLNGAKVTPVLQVLDDEGNLQTINKDEIFFVNHSRSGNVLDIYLSLIPGASQSFLGLPTDQVLDSLFSNQGLLSVENLIEMGDLKINGTNSASLNSPAQCRLFRGGGTNNVLDKTVRTHRGIVTERFVTDNSPPKQVCYKPYSVNTPQENWQKVDAPASLFFRQNNILGCTTFSGENLQDFFRTEEVELNFQSPLTHEACSGMRVSDDYLSMLKAQYSSSISEQDRISILNSIPDYTNLSIVNHNGQNLTLSQVLSRIPTYRSVQLNQTSVLDWHSFSSQILNNPKINEFKIENPFGPNNPVQSLTLQIQQYETGKSISSLIKHADPTPGIISNAFSSSNPDLPINATRYSTFLDKNGEKQELIYPNLFKSTSLASLRQNLTQLEQALTNLSPNNTDYTGRLTTKISAQTDIYSPSRSLSAAHQTKVSFFLSWLNFDLNQKYQQVFKQLLNKENTILFDNLPTSYEIAHITSQTLENSLNFNLLDFSFLESSNPTTQRFQAEFKEQQKQEKFQTQSSGGSGIDLFTYFTDYLPSWYQEQVDKLSSPFKPTPSPSFDINSLLNSRRESAQLKITSQNPVILIDKPVTFNLELLDSENQPTLDSIVFNVTTNLPQAVAQQIDQLNSQNGIQIQTFAGQSIVTFTPTSTGNFNLQFSSENISANYTFQVVENINLEVSLNTQQVQVMDPNGVNFEVRLIGDSQNIIFPTPSINYDTKYASIQYLGGDQAPDQSRVHRYLLLPRDKTTSLPINVRLSQDISTIANIDIIAGQPSQVKFSSSSETALSSSYQTTLNILVLDQYGNLSSNFNSLATIEYDDESKLINPTKQISITNGRGSISFQAEALSFGNVFLKLTTTQSNLSTVHKLNLGSQITFAQDFGQNLNAKILNIFTEETLFGTLGLQSALTDSKVQSISTLTTDMIGFSPIFYIHASGGVDIVNSSQVSSQTNLQNQNLTTIFQDKSNLNIASLKFDLNQFDFNLDNLQDPSKSINLNLFNNNFTLQENKVVFQNQTVIEFNSSNLIQSFHPQVSFEVRNSTFYTLDLIFQNQVFASLTIKPNQPNQVTISPNSSNPDFAFKRAFTLNSTKAPQGFVFYNNKLPIQQSQLPNTPDLRSDDFLNQKLVGLKQGSKLVHLLASENTFGESNRPNLSEAGVVLGDPSIKLSHKPSTNSSNMNFNSTLGLHLDTRPNAIQTGILSLPEFNKVIVTYSDGIVSLFDTETNTYIREWLNVPGGVKSVYKAKLNRESTRLVFLTQNGCSSDDTCIYVFNPFQEEKVGKVQKISPTTDPELGFETNLNSISSLNALDLDIQFKPKQLFFADLNQDGLDDLIIQSDEQIIYLFWNQNGQISKTPFPIGHTRFALDQTSILDKVLVSTNTKTTSVLNIIASDQTIASTINFQKITDSSALSQSTIRLQDVNGGTLQNQDKIRYIVTLSNSSNQTLNNLNLSIPIPSNQTLNLETLSPNNLTFNQTNDTTNRKYIVSNISVPASGTLQFSFETTYQYPTNLDPAIIMLASSDDQALIPIQDQYLDLKVVVPNTDYILYLYSDYNPTENKLTYKRLQIQQTPDITVPNQGIINQLENIQNLSPDQQRTVAETLYNQTLNQDQNNNGINDSYEGSFSGDLASAGQSVENLIKGLTCDDGGCLAVPKNKALLLPSDIPGTELPAFAWGCPPTPPLFVPLWPPQPFQTCNGGRIYVSPTLTGEVAGSVCLGPHLAGVCYSFSITDLGGYCDAINQKVKDVINSAKDYAESESGGVITIGNNSSPNQQSNIEIPGFPAILTSWVANQWDEIQNKILDPPDINIIYPDPQSLIGYVQPQSERDSRRFIFTDPYPQCNSIETFENSPQLCGNLNNYQDVLIAKQNARSKANFNSIQDAKDILSEIAAMPLFNISYETVYVNYPWIEAKEFTDYKLKLFQLWEQIQQEVFIKGTQWGCFANTDYDSIAKVNTALQNKEFLNTVAAFANQSAQVNQACIKLAVGFEGIHLNIQENLRVIQQYADLPKNIIQTENLISDYADQILQYAEQILQATLGWLTENTNTLNQWEQAIFDIESMIGDLQLLLKFAADFIETCDECRSNRTNDDIGQLIEIFASFAPDLPIIEIPRFPDITLDVSHIQAGIDIIIPDIQYKKDLITLPNLNLQLRLPDTPQAALGLETNANFPNGFGLDVYLKAFEIPVLPSPPDIEALDVVLNLPQLPELNLPNLPSLPKPPSISNFTTKFTETINPTINILSTLTRIYCLISKGFVPMPESKIKEQIETMTNRPLAPVLPIDIGFQIPTPTFSESYVSEVIFKLITQLNLEFPQIMEFTQGIANELNQVSTNISDSVEASLAENFQFLNFGSVNILGDELTETIENIDLNLTVPLGLYLPNLHQSISNLNAISSNLNTSLQHEVPSQKNVIVDHKQTLNLNSIQEYQQHRLVQKRNTQFTTKGYQVSTTPQFSQQLISFESSLSSNLIAQANSLSNPQSSFTPQSGLYVVDNSQNVFRLLSYKSPIQSVSKITLVDTDKDNDEDIIYSLEDSIYLKINSFIKNLQSQRPSNPIQLNQSRQSVPSIKTMQHSSFSYSFGHNFVSINIPSHLLDETLFVDTYNINLSTSKSYQRYIVSNQTTLPRGLNSDFTKTINLPSQSTVKIPISNGAYLARISMLDTNNNTINILQSNIPLSPSSCGDQAGPVIISRDGLDIEVPLYSTYTLDLSRSYDVSSDIYEIYLDNNIQVDSDQDGNPLNDRNIQGTENLASTIYRLGPFNQLGNRTYQINMIDVNNNTSSARLNLRVVPPKINLSVQPDNTVLGSLEPISGGTPVTLVRQRNNVISKLAEVTTDSSGKFEYKPDTSSQSIIIKDINQRPLFEVNKSTGTILSLQSAAQIKVEPWQEGVNNTNLSLIYNNQVLTRVQKISDSAFTPILSTRSITQEINQNPNLGIHLQDIQPANQYRASLDQNQVVITNSQQEVLAVITSSGQVSVLSNQLSLEASKVNNINALQTIDFYIESTLQFSLYVNPANSLQLQEPVSIATTRTRVYRPSIEPVVLPTIQDLPSGPSGQAILRLQELGIIEGVQRNGQVFFEPNREIFRSEYAKIILEALCLAPTPPSFQAPQAFSDIPFLGDNQAWFYSYTKETKLLGLFTGYLGEFDQATNLYPFKPQNSITLAEATKVILEALQFKQVLQINPQLDPNAPWYLPYMEISQNLQPYLTPLGLQSSKLQQNQLLSPAEASTPNRFITREEFAVIASRVLDLYNCFELENSNDTNNNQSDQNDPNNQNNQPQPDSSDPNQDTTNQQTLIFPNPSRPGLYIDEIACNSCPCAYTIDDKNGIMRGDVVFAVILGPNQEIYSQSNLVLVQL